MIEDTAGPSGRRNPGGLSACADLTVALSSAAVQEAGDAVPLWLELLAASAERLAEAARLLEAAWESGPARPPGSSKPSELPPGSLVGGSAARAFRLEGAYWTLSYGGTTVRLRDLKGLHYMVYLLARPGREVHVSDLVAAAGDAFPVEATVRALRPGPREGCHVDTRCGDALLDPAAKAGYHRRLVELEDEIEEASNFCDLEPVPAPRTSATSS